MALSLCKNPKKFTISGYTSLDYFSNSKFDYPGIKFSKELYSKTKDMKFYQRQRPHVFFPRLYDKQFEYEEKGENVYTITKEVISNYVQDTEVYIR